LSWVNLMLLLNVIGFSVWRLDCLFKPPCHGHFNDILMREYEKDMDRISTSISGSAKGISNRITTTTTTTTILSPVRNLVSCQEMRVLRWLSQVIVDLLSRISYDIHTTCEYDQTPIYLNIHPIIFWIHRDIFRSNRGRYTLFCLTTLTTIQFFNLNSIWSCSHVIRIL
jgi:hypothetical protein